MKNSCNLSKLIVVIAQLFLLGGCYSFNKSENPPSIDIASLQEPDKKCLEVLKQGLEKYKDITAKLDTIDITNNQSAPQPISSRAKNLSSDLQKLIGAKECQPPASTESVSNVIAQVKELDTEVLLMADALKNKQKIKEKVDSIKLDPPENPNSNELDTLERKFVKYTDDKLKILLTKQLDKISSPSNIVPQVNALQKQIKTLSDEVTNQSNTISGLKQDLSSFKGLFALSLLILLPVVGFGSYFLTKRSHSPSDNPKTSKQKERPNKSEFVSKSVAKDTSRNRKGLGSDSTTTSSFPSQTSTPIKKDSDNDQKTKQKEDKEKSTQVYDGQDRVIKEVRDVDNINRSSTDTFTAEKSSQQVYVAQQLTYDIAFQCYQNGSYESLQSYSQGYYSATPESMMRNRAYWGNPIELVQSYDGLFWIIKTIDSHCMLFPNPDKRIEQTRIPGIEYFFETNFKNENYHSCIVTDPAYMNYEDGKWLILQKGRINFVY
jgi:hypothetical protein